MRASWDVFAGMRPVYTTRQRPYAMLLYSVQDVHKQASVLTPSMFIAQLPQIPSLQLRLNVKVGSTSFLMRINASSIIGPVLFRSSVYDCILGFSVGVSGDQR